MHRLGRLAKWLGFFVLGALGLIWTLSEVDRPSAKQFEDLRDRVEVAEQQLDADRTKIADLEDRLARVDHAPN